MALERAGEVRPGATARRRPGRPIRLLLYPQPTANDVMLTDEHGNTFPLLDRYTAGPELESQSDEPLQQAANPGVTGVYLLSNAANLGKGNKFYLTIRGVSFVLDQLKDGEKEREPAFQ
jgi:hypothetical protein